MQFQTDVCFIFLQKNSESDLSEEKFYLYQH